MTLIPKPSRSRFATPRSWSFVIQLLTDELDESTTTDMVSGAVGEGLAVVPWSQKSGKQVAQPSEILDGKVDTLKPRK